MKVTMQGATLNFEGLAKKKSLTIAAVADARGDDEETLRGAAALREIFLEEGVDVVLSLGGHGKTEQATHALLSAISTKAPYLTVALPGDRESIPAHRKAVRSLAKSGARVLDGAQYRLLSLGDLLVATMPGIAMGANLIAGNDGCLHTEADTADLIEFIEKSESRVLLASYAPVRQEGSEGSDLGAGGIHVGETLLKPLLATEKLALRIHGMVGGRSSPTKGKHRMGPGSRTLAAGSLDALDGPSTALILAITGKKLSWRRVVAEP
jgi:hypothetical protein